VPFDSDLRWIFSTIIAAFDAPKQFLFNVSAVCVANLAAN